jgi:site-specific DNA recombinase
MIVAVYARKSTEQNVSEDARSVTRQVELARAFAERRGWTVSDEHVYIDDAVSGADFMRRAGLTRLLAAASAKHRPFDIIVAMDESRIGRDQYRTAYVLQQIADAGIQLWYYQEQRQAKLDDATGKFMESVRGFAAEMEREKARARTREPLRRKAAQGFVAGGRCFGYTIKRQGSNSVRIVDQAEARIVVSIFEQTVAGLGVAKIAGRLNDEGVRSPLGRGWTPSAIREILRRETYVGRLVYGKTRAVDRNGSTRVQENVPPSEWVIVEKPELRIVSAELWTAAHDRIERTKQVYSGKHTAGGPRAYRDAGLDSKHLLSGFLTCGLCGGGLFVRSTTIKGQTYLYYRCVTNWKLGASRCRNRYSVPYNAITQAVVDHFSHRFLTPQAMAKFFEDERAAREPEKIAAERAGLTADIRRLDAELARMAEAIATASVSIPSAVGIMEHKQRARDNAAARIETLDKLAAEVEKFDAAAFLAAGGDIVVDLEDLLQNDPATGRGILRALLVGPITVTPVGTAKRARGGRPVTVFDYRGEAVLDPLLSGQIGTDGRVTHLPTAEKTRR